MSRQHHEIKCETRFFQAVETKEKKFEIRKNDRGFRLFDMVTLEETVKGERTGRKLGPFEISYVFNEPGFGLEEGYVIFSWEMS